MATGKESTGLVAIVLGTPGAPLKLGRVPRIYPILLIHCSGTVAGEGRSASICGKSWS